VSALTFDDYDQGFTHVTLSRTITEYDASSFIRNNGFNTPMFMDLEYANDPTLHGGRVVPGMLTISLAEGLCIGSGLVGKYGLALLEYRRTGRPAC
jgi:acyl dehydratase